MIKEKIKGDKGHPWRVPLVMWKGLERKPLASTLADVVVYKALS